MNKKLLMLIMIMVCSSRTFRVHAAEQLLAARQPILDTPAMMVAGALATSMVSLLEDWSKGEDLLACGRLHWRRYTALAVGGALLLAAMQEAALALDRRGLIF